jgi:hypothetical protein
MEGRRCSACGCEKPLDQFKIKYIHADRTVHQAYCIACQREYRQRHYLNNKQEYYRRNREREGRIRSIVEQAKARPCADCGVPYAPWQMDFDHVSGLKLMKVADFVRLKKSIRLLRAEMAKCEVVCANCHRNRTHYRRITMKESREEI